MVGSGPAEEALSRCLISAVQQPIRRHFALLTWDGVLDKVPPVCSVCCTRAPFSVDPCPTFCLAAVRVWERQREKSGDSSAVLRGKVVPEVWLSGRERKMHLCEAPRVCWQHSAVAESAKALVDAAQDVPSELLAKVVKCLLLQLKRQDQQNRQSEQVKV